MEDSKIIELYNLRDPSAIAETERKYSPYLMTISYNILNNHEDSKECLNDTYLKAWNTIPPNFPAKLRLYLAKITRDISIDVRRKRLANKRLTSEYAVSLSELGECVPISDGGFESEAKALSEVIEDFLSEQSEECRNLFIWRYYYCDSIKSISAYTGWSSSKLTSMLYRMRESLRKRLEKEEIAL